MNKTSLIINEALVRHLITSQFPQWKHFPVRPVTHGGWDNRMFHLGEHMVVRLASAQRYAAKIEKEYQWLPILAPLLPLSIPRPLVMGNPTQEYPYHWSVYQWIDGESAVYGSIENLTDFATNLAHFLLALYRIDSTNGPHNFYRAGALSVYDAQTREALAILKNKIDSSTAAKIWQDALATQWNREPVWVHGDVSQGNVLVKNGQLNAVIDFGGMAVGDPAGDLAITWTLFKGESREMFRSLLAFDTGTWMRTCMDIVESINYCSKCYHYQYGRRNALLGHY
jgi:aminoglycoside phosphotransferase (APT) family kinase protein